MTTELKNRIREFRLKAGMSQRALAEKAGTSQQQVARIERGAQQASVALAGKLCSALGQPMEKLFPGSASAVRRMRSMDDREYGTDILNGGELSDEMAKAGIDLDPRTWFLKMRLSNGTTHVFNVSGSEQRRIRNLIQSTSDQFVVFDTDTARVMVNLDHLEYAHWLYEAFPPSAVIRDEDSDTSEGQGDNEDEDPNKSVIVYTAGSRDALMFGVDPDEDEENGEFNHIFGMAELQGVDDPRYHFHFEDEDGEEVFLLSTSVSMLSAPLWVIDPNALDAQSDLIEADEDN